MENRDRFKSILESFEQYYPNINERAVDWYPSGQMEIIVRTDDGNKYEYCCIDHSIKLVKNDNYNCEELDEKTWRELFSYKLHKKLYMSSLNQESLSSKTGISRVTISKYLNGKATPSVYNLEKIARALKCSINELC